MGTFRHHALIVTVDDYATVKMLDDEREHEGFPLWKHLHGFAAAVTARTTPVCVGINGCMSFAVLPDGSKEGWEDSDHADRQRNKLVEEFERLWRLEGGSVVVRLDPEGQAEGRRAHRCPARRRWRSR